MVTRREGASRDAEPVVMEITVFAPDRVGLIADVSEALAESNVNIDSVSVETSGGNAIIRIITPKESEARAKEALERGGFKTFESNVLVVSLPDRPGELASISRKFAEHGINIENVFLLSKQGAKSVLAFKVSDYDKAKALMEKHA